MNEEFVSQPIQPVEGTFDSVPMAAGLPSLPRRFFFDAKEYEIAEIVSSWKEAAPCRHGSGEKYLRKHWFKIATVQGERMTIYFERQARSAKQAKTRWWLYTIER